MIQKQPGTWAQSVRGEFVIQVQGTVEARRGRNGKCPTGYGVEIEVRCNEISVLNKSVTPPFPLTDKEADRVSEDLRLEFRYLDLRRRRGCCGTSGLRHEIAHSIRNYLDKKQFSEIETPILTKSTPEGARDYLVPSRVYAGFILCVAAGSAAV